MYVHVPAAKTSPARFVARTPVRSRKGVLYGMGYSLNGEEMLGSVGLQANEVARLRIHYFISLLLYLILATV